MALNYPRAGEVDTPEEVAKAFQQVIDEIKGNKARIDQMADSDQLPSDGEVVVVNENGNFYAGIATNASGEDRLVDVTFFDGDDGCFSIDDLVKKGAKDA